MFQVYPKFTVRNASNAVETREILILMCQNIAYDSYWNTLNPS